MGGQAELSSLPISFLVISYSNMDEDKEFQQLVQMEAQKAEISANVSKLTDRCWETCSFYPKGKMDGRTETCLNNCVQRYFDLSLLLQQRFMQKAQQMQQHQ